MGAYKKSHSQTGVEARNITVVEPGSGARMGKRSLSGALRVNFTMRVPWECQIRDTYVVSSYKVEQDEVADLRHYTRGL